VKSSSKTKQMYHDDWENKSGIKQWVSLVYSFINISVLKSHENDPFLCNSKSNIFM
jgi:hypothetical protein